MRRKIGPKLHAHRAVECYNWKYLVPMGLKPTNAKHQNTEKKKQAARPSKAQELNASSRKHGGGKKV
jgi:hypothetical protein